MSFVSQDGSSISQAWGGGVRRFANIGRHDGLCTNSSSFIPSIHLFIHMFTHVINIYLVVWVWI